MYIVVSFSTSIYMSQICIARERTNSLCTRLLSDHGRDSQMTPATSLPLHLFPRESSDTQSKPTTTANFPSFHMALPAVSKDLFISTSPGTFLFASTFFPKSFNRFPTSLLKLPCSLCFICQDLLDRHQQTPELSEQQTSWRGPLNRTVGGQVRTSAGAEDLTRPTREEFLSLF